MVGLYRLWMTCGRETSLRTAFLREIQQLGGSPALHRLRAWTLSSSPTRFLKPLAPVTRSSRGCWRSGELEPSLSGWSWAWSYQRSTAPEFVVSPASAHHFLAFIKAATHTEELPTIALLLQQSGFAPGYRASYWLGCQSKYCVQSNCSQTAIAYGNELNQISNT